MLTKLMIFVLLLIPVVAFGQENVSSGRHHELIVNSLTISDKIENVEHFFSVEFRWDAKEMPNTSFFSGGEKVARFVPGIELEYLKDSASGENIFFERYSRLIWLKGYLTFRTKNRVRPYVGGAVGWDVETINAGNGLNNISRTNNGPTADALAGVNFYPGKRFVLVASAKAWRPSLNFGAGFTF